MKLLTSNPLSRQISLVILFLAVWMLASACGNTTAAPATPDTQVILTIGELTPEYRTVTFDVHKQNNCGGNSTATYKYEQIRSVLHSMTVEGGFTVNANGEVGVPGTGLKLGAELALRMGQTYGTESSVARSLELSAKPGTYVEHKINLQEVWQKGIARAGLKAATYEIPFSYRSDFALELVESKELPCPTPAVVLPKVTAYDSFDNSCISTSLWQSGVDSLKDPIFLPKPAGNCWVFDPGFLEETSLTLEHRTKKDFQSFYLVAYSPKPVSTVELDFSVDAVDGGWAEVGIFTRLNNTDRTWAYYYLHFGEGINSGYGQANYQDGTNALKDIDLVPINMPVTLTLYWDGSHLNFLANGSKRLQPIPFSGLSDTFGIYWVTSPNTYIRAHVTQIRTDLDR